MENEVTLKLTVTQLEAVMCSISAARIEAERYGWNKDRQEALAICADAYDVFWTTLTKAVN
jgi:hypothetical protein